MRRATPTLDPLRLIPRDVFTTADDADDRSATEPGRGCTCRRERPHPGAQLGIEDVEDMRITAFARGDRRCGRSVGSRVGRPAPGPQPRAPAQVRRHCDPEEPQRIRPGVWVPGVGQRLYGELHQGAPEIRRHPRSSAQRRRQHQLARYTSTCQQGQPSEERPSPAMDQRQWQHRPGKHEPDLEQQHRPTRPL